MSESQYKSEKLDVPNEGVEPEKSDAHLAMNMAQFQIMMEEHDPEWDKGRWDDPHEVLRAAQEEINSHDEFALDWLEENAKYVEDGRKRIIAHIIVPRFDDGHTAYSEFVEEWIPMTGRTAAEYRDTCHKGESIDHAKSIGWLLRNHPEFFDDECVEENQDLT